MFNFERLDVWRASIEFADLVYSIAKAFPRDERFGLTNQMRRASVSVSANLAEGNSRSSAKEYQRFIEIAFGSLMEVVSHSAIARRQAFLTEEQHQQIYHFADRVGRMLSGLRNSLNE